MTALHRITRVAALVLSILFTLAVAAFGVAVHTEGIEQGTGGEKALSLVLHLLPAALMAAVVVLAWRRPLVGAIACGLLGVGYCASSWSKFPWDTLVTVAGPLMLAAALFFAAWLTRPKTARMA